MEELVKYLRALVALELRRAMNGGDEPVRADLVLADLGFSAKEIAGLSGKSVAAVAKAITRGRAVTTKEEVSG